MQRYLAYILITCLAAPAGLTGCSPSRIPGGYKPVVQQGNVVTDEMLDTLKPGMTRQQVLFVMGSPVLQNPFTTDRWDYTYTHQIGTRPREVKRTSLFFRGDRLVNIQTDLRDRPMTRDNKATS